MTRKSTSAIPGHPDTATHQLIRTKEGIFWRAKRGLHTPPVINSSMRAHAERMKQAAPAARRIAIALAPYTADLQKGRLIAAISGRLLRCLRREGNMQLSALSGLELQPEWTLGNLLCASYRAETVEAANIVRVRILQTGSAPVRARNKLIDSYEITAVLLQGDPGEEGGVKTVSATTERLPISEPPGEILLSLPLPDTGADYVLALRVECFEEGKAGMHPGLRAMRIISTT